MNKNSLNLNSKDIATQQMIDAFIIYIWVIASEHIFPRR